MEKLNVKSKYLVIVDMDEVAPNNVAEKLRGAGIEAVVLAVPSHGHIEFLEIVGNE
jgi:hypothetical protein